MHFNQYPACMEAFRKFRKRIKYFFLGLFIRLMLLVIRIIPWNATTRLTGKLGALAFLIVKKEREKTIRNLTIAYGREKSPEEIREMAREVWINLGKSAGEFAIKLHITDKEKYFRNVEVIGLEHGKKALERGKGALFIVSHIGCWEGFSNSFMLLGMRAGAVGQKMHDEKLNEMLMKSRQRLGFRLLPRGSSYKTILKFLSDNHSMGILIDQDTKVKGVFVDFYGKPAWTPIGAAMLALDSEASVMAAYYLKKPDDTWQIIIKPEFRVIRTGDRKHDLQKNTEMFHKDIEEMIKKYPTQWVWMHERWKTTPAMVAERERRKKEERLKRRQQKK